MPSSPTIATASCREIYGWSLLDYLQLPSTNPVAGHLPIWHAVRAESQTAGYGRTGTVWVSDRGGLWLSAVVPATGPMGKWSILPLAVGWTLIALLEELGVRNLRLRWPNDLMIGHRKLAGILVERFQPGRAVIGIGLNVLNHPDESDGQLCSITTNLAAQKIADLNLDHLTEKLLIALRHMVTLVESGLFPEIAANLNTRWSSHPPKVRILLNQNAQPVYGHLLGIDHDGRLRLSLHDGVTCLFAAHEVAQLRELD